MKHFTLSAAVALVATMTPSPLPLTPVSAVSAQVATDDESPKLWVHFEEGKPVDRRPTEKKDNVPAFPEQTRAPYRKTAPFTVTTLISNLEVPWSLAFLPSGNIILTERLPGRLRIFHTNGTLSAPLAGVNVVATPGSKDIGLLDVALDPNFATNRRIFFSFFSYIDGTNTNTCIARATLDEQGLKVTDATVIFRALPIMPSKRLGAKTGGRIVFDKAGNLLMPLGDRSDSPPWDVAQKMDTHLGKIVRIAPDGTVPADNPFVGQTGVLPEIWATGTRSVEGLAYDPRTGKLWQNDHGPRGGDELNIIEKGKNYGWPIVARGIDYPGTAIGVTRKEGMEEPVYFWDPVIGPSGLAFYTGNLFPQWKNSMFVGGLRGAMLARLEMKNDKVVGEEPLLTELRSRIRDVRVGPDGAVYVLTDSGTPTMTYGTPPTSKLLKLTPK
jgi:glucose/arabinose dehydrogenase